MVASIRNLLINGLISGGMITNYFCTSSCGHCLYSCSPKREKDYIESTTLVANLKKIKALGCGTIHVGGGEPFLSLKGLQMVVETTLAMGVGIEYVETNSSWFKDGSSARNILSSLKERGLSTLLISMSPFHNEYIPFFKVKGVIAACQDVGIHVFPWIMDFYEEIDAFEETKTHSISEYEARYGQGYLEGLPSRYWIHFGGRALQTFAPVLGATSCEKILSSNRHGCDELMGVSHFHFDLFGNYIPGLCSGLAIQRDDLGGMVSDEKYPLLHTLYHKGIGGLFEFVSREHGFSPAPQYMSKCHLCIDLRRHLFQRGKNRFIELQPEGFYG
ncbi:radical SAM protein [Thermodesulfobacteriota bacterium]